MKKLYALLLTLVLALSLAACGTTENQETAVPSAPDVSQETTAPEETCAPEAPVAQDLDMETVYQNILTMINADDSIVLFPESNPDIIGEFYEGLSDIELKQQALYIHPITGFACEVMLIEVANESDVQSVIEICEGRIALGSDDTFYAETAALWKTNAQVQSSGNYVCMIALPENYEIPENVFAE